MSGEVAMVAILGFSKDQVTVAVQDMYAAVAASPEGGFHFPVGRSACLALGYTEDELSRVPDAAVASFAGVGNPFGAGVIGPGDTVLDIGAGSGTDTLLARGMVGEKGKVWAFDITPAMLKKLRQTAEAEGIANVETIEGDAEHIPLPDNSVDVVTSNGALNLVPDKRRAFAEIFRVLRPEGRIQIADVVISRPVPLGGRSDPQLWAECVVGAAVDEDYLELFRQAGFTDVKVLRELDYFSNSPSEDTRRIAASLGARTMEISMQRPANPATPPLLQRLQRRLHPKRLRAIGARGLWGAVAAAAALAACYGTLALLGLLAMFGLTVSLNESVWAATIAGAALVSVVATGFNARRHSQPWPVAVAGLGAGLIVYAMFVTYDPLVEAAGFMALIGAVALDLYMLYRAELC